MDTSEKNNIFLNSNFMQYNAALDFEIQNANKINAFKERFAQFEKISTLEEAKALAARILPTANEITSFYVGNAKCVVVNRKNMLRISIDTAKEFICYDIS